MFCLYFSQNLLLSVGVGCKSKFPIIFDINNVADNFIKSLIILVSVKSII